MKLAYLLLTALPLFAVEKIPVLIVDGQNNHDWQTGTREIQGILAESGRFAVDVSTTPPANAPKEAWDQWYPAFARYKVVIDNFNGGHLATGTRWPEPVEKALVQYVRGGGGLVIFHAANNAFLNWPEFNDMIGLGWRDPSFGDGLAFDAGHQLIRTPKGSGAKPGHGPRHDFEIEVMNAAHPITKGLPAKWQHPSEQLTHGQHGPAEGLTILTAAMSEVTHQYEPMDWVRDYGQGRVYATMLGHTWRNEPNPNLADPNFRKLFAQGVLWAAQGK